MLAYYSFTFGKATYDILVENCMPYIPLMQLVSNIATKDAQITSCSPESQKSLTLPSGATLSCIPISKLSELSRIAPSGVLNAFNTSLRKFLTEQQVVFFLGTKISSGGKVIDYYNTKYGDVAVMNYNNQKLVSLRPFMKYFECDASTVSRHIKGASLRGPFSETFDAPFGHGSYSYVNLNVLTRISHELKWKIDSITLAALKVLATPEVPVDNSLVETTSPDLIYTELRFKQFGEDFIPVIRDVDGVYRISITALCEKMNYHSSAAFIRYHYSKMLPSACIYTPGQNRAKRHYFASPSEIHFTSTEMEKAYPKDILDWFRTIWETVPHSPETSSTKEENDDMQSSEASEEDVITQSSSISIPDLNINDLTNAIIDELASRFKR